MSQEEALKRIAQAKAEGWKKLDVVGLDLTELPPEIGELNQLECLILGYWDREKSVIVGNNLSTLPPEIGQLTALTQLNLWNNRLSSLPPEIGQLTALTQLNLWNNRLSSLPPEIGQLTALTQLSLSYNPLSSLPPEIVQLSALTELYLSFNQLSSLPPEIVQLTALTELDLSDNQLSSLPPEIVQLTALTQLDLSGNQLSSLPPEIVQLTALTQLNLRSNQLSSLPDFIRELPKLEKLDLRGNPLPIPPEILGPPESWEDPGDLKTVLAFYFESQDLPDTDPLYEAKLLIVGEGGAGKTSLAKKIQNPDYELEKEERSTEGIDVIRWEMQHPDGHDFRINIWDFGGQEIYHATHQFFLTKRSLYLLVADTREENTDFYYWLNVIELLSDNSPVLIIKNEKQDRQCQIDERSLRGEFTNLRDTLATNLATNRGLEPIQTAIQHYASRLDHIGTPLPGRWARIRAVLENYRATRNYIELHEYFALCRQNDFTDETQMLGVSQYLHDLGICLHFQKVKLLKKIVILRPEWATNAVYKIFDNATIQNNFGRFSDDDLEQIWDEDDTAKMRDELLTLMMQFELCYKIPGCQGRYIAPRLLSKECPDYTWDNTHNLILRYRYTFKPKDILPRFIVAMHEQIEGQSLVWKHGVVLTNGSARAEISEEDRYHNAEIRIRVSGFNQRHLLSIVAYELEKIQNTYERLNYQTLIPCNCDTCKGSQDPHTYTWENLNRRLQNRRYEIECDKSYAQVKVRSLLDDIIEPQLTRSEEFGARKDLGSQRSLFDQASISDKQKLKFTAELDLPTMNNTTENNFYNYGDGPQVAGNYARRDYIEKQVNLSPEHAQTLEEFQTLSTNAAEGFDPTSEKGQKFIKQEILEALNKNPTLKQRVLAALQASGEAAIDVFVEHPAAKIGIAAAKGLLTGEA